MAMSRSMLSLFLVLSTFTLIVLADIRISFPSTVQVNQSMTFTWNRDADDLTIFRVALDPIKDNDQDQVHIVNLTDTPTLLSGNAALSPHFAQTYVLHVLTIDGAEISTTSSFNVVSGRVFEDAAQSSSSASHMTQVTKTSSSQSSTPVSRISVSSSVASTMSSSTSNAEVSHGSQPVTQTSAISRSKSTKIIVAAVLGGTVVVLIAIIILLLRYRRRKREHEDFLAPEPYREPSPIIPAASPVFYHGPTLSDSRAPPISFRKPRSPIQSLSSGSEHD
ncbi:hypothetical protein C8J56DRAFT_1029266, partial [Mycena floridula]